MSIQDELDKIVSGWEADCVFDETNIQSENIRTPQLHAKYLRYLKHWKSTKLELQIRYDEVKGKKSKYWKGEMSKEELDKLGWPQWRYKAPLKSEIETYINSDSDLNKIKIQAEAIQLGIDLIESIIKQIGQRDYEIGNFIKLKKFYQGEDF